MWLLLERRHDHAQSAQQLTTPGVCIEFIEREEDLTQIDVSTVTLVLVAPGWKRITLDRLRASGLTADAVLVVDQIDRFARESALALGCVDVVMYPLPLQYLRSFEPSAAVMQDTHDVSVRSLSTLDEILHTTPSKTSTWQTLKNTATLDEGLLRGRLVVFESARGGAGKTTLSVLCAHELSLRNLDVVVVDLDPKGTLLYTTRTESYMTTDEWMKLPAQMDERTVRQSLTPAHQFWLLPSGRQAESFEEPAVRKLLFNLLRHFDVVLVDTSQATRCLPLLEEWAHRVVFLVTPEWSAYERYVETMEGLRAQKRDAVLAVCNRVQTRRLDHRRMVEMMINQGHMRFAATLREDPTLSERWLEGKIVKDGPLIRGVRDLVSGFGFDPELVESREPVKRRRWL